jgi:hypothetical protein
LCVEGKKKKKKNLFSCWTKELIVSRMKKFLLSLPKRGLARKWGLFWEETKKERLKECERSLPDQPLGAFGKPALFLLKKKKKNLFPAGLKSS